jgi:hypothetical protein
MLKRIFAWSVILCVIYFPFVAAEEMQQKDVLEFFRSHANNALQTLDLNMQEAVNVIQKNGINSAEAKSALEKLYVSTPFLTDCAIINSKGIMITVEPPAAKNLEGTDLSQQEQVKKLHEIKKPFLSNMFMAAEGDYGIVLQYPVFSPMGEFVGSVSAFFKPRSFLSSLSDAILEGSKLEVWIIDDNGMVIYDQDSAEIGKNVITDEAYKAYPECIAFAKNAISQDSGDGSYEFLAKGLKQPVKKNGIWTNVAMHDAKWHIVVVEIEGREMTFKEACMQQIMDEVIKDETQTAVSLLSIIYEQSKSKNMSFDETKKMAADFLRELRYGDNQEGYFWADTLEGVNVVLYGRKDIEGTNRYEANINGVYYIKEIIEKGKRPGGGYTDYWFPKKGEDAPCKKRGYSLVFEPFGWVVGTGYYPENPAK